jgi:hypothetical protein
LGAGVLPFLTNSRICAKIPYNYFKPLIYFSTFFFVQVYFSIIDSYTFIHMKMKFHEWTQSLGELFLAISFVKVFLQTGLYKIILIQSIKLTYVFRIFFFVKIYQMKTMLENTIYRELVNSRWSRFSVFSINVQDYIPLSSQTFLI